MYYEIIYRQTNKDSLTATHHHHNNTIEFIHIEEGEGKILIDDNIYEFASGYLFVFDAEMVHCTYPENPSEYVRNKLIIDKGILSAITGMQENNRQIKASPKTSKELSAIFKSAEMMTRSEDMRILAWAEIVKIINICCEEQTSIYHIDSGCVYETIKYINEHLTEKISLDTLAQKIHISKYHLCRRFKEETGMSVFTYLKSQRISMAKELLSKTDMPITYIALETGFGDISCFTKCFKAETGITPSEYRKENNV